MDGHEGSRQTVSINKTKYEHRIKRSAANNYLPIWADGHRSDKPLGLARRERTRTGIGEQEESRTYVLHEIRDNKQLFDTNIEASDE